jgi:hypothetical protein
MDKLAEMIEMAELCARNARAANSRGVARTLWKMANEYAERAAKLDNGRMPEIDDPPALLK